jgi:hypothetical protein
VPHQRGEPRLALAERPVAAPSRGLVLDGEQDELHVIDLARV